MANIINGTDTGSGGLITTGDSSDELQLQTAETTAITIDSSQNVGVGTTTPDTLLHLSDADGNAIIRLERDDTIISTNDVYGSIEFEGQDASSSSSGVRGSITGISEGTGGNMALVFSTAPFTGTNTERMRLTSDGYLRMASGTGGIQFGGDTAAANALDDYEEGTWTPTISTSNADVTVSSYLTRSGTYTKIGRVVYAQCALRAQLSSAGTGNPTVTGFPYTSLQTSAATITLWDLLGSQPGYTYYEPFGSLNGTTYAFQNSGWTTNPALAGYLFMYVVYEV